MTKLTVSCFIVDQQEEFTMHIDAPIESEAESARKGESLRLRGSHKHGT
jgi:hypothetical protein